MKKKIPILIMFLVCLGFGYGYQHWTQLGRIFEEVNSLQLKFQNIKENELLECSSSTAYGTKDIKHNEVTIYWEDTVNTAWEYYVVPAGDPVPVASGTPTTTKENTIIQDSNGNPLQPNTEYEYYVRTVCGAGYGDWEGYFEFKTLCVPFVLPFQEDFSTTSISYDCWTIIDANTDKMDFGIGDEFIFNSWVPVAPIFPLPFYRGDRYMYFNGDSKKHDDWLISPAFDLDKTALYSLTYYYKTEQHIEDDFEILLSVEGIDLNAFKTVLYTHINDVEVNYTKKTIYIQNVGGEAHIAWHVITNGASQIDLDLVRIERVDCIGPDENIVISNISANSAIVEWKDDMNGRWEYYVQAAGGGMPASGTPTTIASAAITTDQSGVTLQPNTEYEVYVRSSCGAGKYSPWIGPVVFKTACVVQTLPFWEGFNSDSTTNDCWRVIDQNKDINRTTNNNTWSLHSTAYEGNASMGLVGNTLKLPHNDWLVSPAFSLDSAKFYRLKYNYRTHSQEQFKTNFNVLLSNKGADPEDFTIALETKDELGSTIWKEETLIIGELGGDVNIAWHIDTNDRFTELYIDNVLVEEVVGCPEPFRLNSTDEETNQVTIAWEGYGKNWEYVVQKKEKSFPSGSGISVLNRELTIIQDNEGSVLEPNTEYEFYVRTDCGNGDYSIWSGPYIFRTACKEVYDTPFWEGFNSDSESANCWTIVDGNEDGRSDLGANIWQVSNKIAYEGTEAMEFNSDPLSRGRAPHDDWLISPAIHFEQGKTYRLKYHYRTHSLWAPLALYEFEVLASDSGADIANFSEIVVPERVYESSLEWKEEYIFISELNGKINIAWHITAEAPYITLYIDNVFIEEVLGCPEPLGLIVEDIESNQVTLAWEDDMGSVQYEYYVQLEGQGVPSVNGINTKNKKVVVNKDNEGEQIKGSTDYEFYVRANCGNGEYSIWQGPYQFTTLCDIYPTPFWEGFNSDSETIQCWTTFGDRDGVEETIYEFWSLNPPDNQFPPYEGNGYINFVKENLMQLDDWLISPTIEMDGSLYMLSYYYSTLEGVLSSEHEVLLSKLGVGIDRFDTEIVPLQSFVNRGEYYKQKVAFIEKVDANINLAWHVTKGNIGTATFYLDNIMLKKIKTCPEPYYVTVIDQTSTAMDVEWEQYDSVTEWEVIVVDYGESETATPIQTVTVTSTPQTTITGLNEGRAYTIYVRAKCTDGKSYSDWSTPVTGVTKVGANDNCDGAIDIPVNDSLECIESVDVTLFGATASSAPTPDCAPYLENDIWFAFTATSESHLFQVERLTNNIGLFRISGALYGSACDSISAVPLECFNSLSIREGKLFTDLTLGKRYYIRLGISKSIIDKRTQTVLNLCLTASPYLRVNESGMEYTVEELVKDVLVNSSCSLASNVHYQNGDGSPVTQTINTLGYFNRGNSDFPFEEGVVLSTGPVEYVPGPYGGTTGSNPNRWAGDKDINDAINDAGGGPRNDKRVTQLEFDFIPITDSIHFEYLLASNSYQIGCVYACENAALFAAWLIDTTTGEGQNLAKIPGTNLPISLNTIWDSQKIPHTNCGAVNPEFFWNSYASSSTFIDAPVNYVGSTIAMFSETVPVVPGRQYHIKLAVIDFCPSDSHTSAAFFNANSFDLGNLDLGPDLLVETNNALCEEESVVIQSGMAFSDELETEVEWYKDGVLLTGEKQPDLEVSESGEYEVRVHFLELDCAVSGSIQVEIYPPISEVVHQPRMITVCRSSLEDIIVDLEQVEAEMFSQSGKDSYTAAYFETEEEAALNENPLQNTIDYNLGKAPESHTLYIRVDNTETGCHEVFEFSIEPQRGNVPQRPDNVTVCAEYVFPELESNQYYYSESGAGGVEYKAEEVLDIPGEHTIYVLQLNDEDGCYEETSYKVSITEAVVADVFEAVEIECELYELQSLSKHNRYFTEPNGGGTELYAGMEIPLAQTIYVYAESEDGLCVDESSFAVTYNDCPIPRGISPNGDGFNDTFDLSRHGVESIKIYNRWGTEVYSHGLGYTDQWYGQNKSGKQLPDGTYYYVIIAHGKTRTGWVQINR